MSDLYIKYSDVIPIEKNRELTREEKKIYDLGFFDCSEKAEAEHKAMCETCVHKVSAEDIKQIRNDAIDECKQILLDAIARDGKTKCYEYMVAVNEMKQLKEGKNG